MNKKTQARAQELANRPYTVRMTKDVTTEDEPIYLASNPELPGCQAQGKTIEEAVKELDDARVDYIASLLEDGLSVPGPAQEELGTSGATATDVWSFTAQPPMVEDFMEALIPVVQRTSRETLYEVAIKT